jgi:hypothetical protein
VLQRHQFGIADPCKLAICHRLAVVAYEFALAISQSEAALSPSARSAIGLWQEENMDNTIKRHLQGCAQTLEALDLIRKGVAPAEAASRLLLALAGKDCLGSFTDREFRQLSNKLNWSAQNLIRAAHETHSIFTHALEGAGVIAPVANSRAATGKTTPERRAYMRDLMRRKRAAERKASALSVPNSPIAHLDGATDGVGTS